MGPGPAHWCLQRALHACGFRLVAIDGILGPQTINAANAVKPQAALLAALRTEAAAYYRELARADPNRERFLTGWLNRAYE